MNSKRATKSEAPTLPNTAPAAKKWHSAVTKFHSVTRSFCYFFFLWHVLVSFGLRKIGSFLHQVSSFFGLLLRYNFWWFLFFFCGKKSQLFVTKTHPTRVPTLVPFVRPGERVGEDIGFPAMRPHQCHGILRIKGSQKKAGIRLCPKKPLKRDPGILKYIYII